jgi:SAM-dependent methyltransferase
MPQEKKSPDPGKKRVLHVGCGPKISGKLHALFSGDDWEEIRLDIDPRVAPDIVASITDLSGIQDNTMDALYSSHNLEHLYAHEVPVCLKEFLRVLKPEGFALIAVPNLKRMAESILKDEMDTPLYTSEAGPIYPIDMLYGFTPAIARGNTHMAHRTGFTPKSLGSKVLSSGFAVAQLAEDSGFGLWIKAYKQIPEQDLKDQPLW